MSSVPLPLQLHVPVLNCACPKFRWFFLLCQALHKTFFPISRYASCPLLYWGIPHAFGLKFHLQQTYCSHWLWSPSTLIPLHIFSSLPFILWFLTKLLLLRQVLLSAFFCKNNFLPSVFSE